MGQTEEEEQDYWLQYNFSLSQFSVFSRHFWRGSQWGSQRGSWRGSQQEDS